MEIQLVHNVVLVFGVQQSDSVTYTYIYTHTYISFHILFHYSLLQDAEYSFLCYTVGPCCLCIVYIALCIS